MPKFTNAVTIHAGRVAELEEYSSISDGSEKIFTEKILGFLRKSETDLPQNSAIPLLNLYPKGSSSYHKDTGSGILIAALFIITTKRNKIDVPGIKMDKNVEYS